MANFDIVHQGRAASAPMDHDRGFYSTIDFGSLDAPEIIPAGSTQRNEGRDKPFAVTSWNHRQGWYA